MDQLSRITLLLGDAAVLELKGKRVAVFGIGGVGSYAAEALVRTGVGAIDLIDNDTVSHSNINRQLFALHSTVGRLKVDVAEERLHDVSPECKITKWPLFYLPETADQIDLSQYDYILDCVDTVAAKISLVEQAYALNVPIISSMGAGNKLDPTLFQVADISKTSVDPLARAIRQRLRKKGIHHLKVVYSTEIPIAVQGTPEDLPDSEVSGQKKRAVPGSIAFVPSVAGLIMASQVIKDLIKVE